MSATHRVVVIGGGPAAAAAARLLDALEIPTLLVTPPVAPVDEAIAPHILLPLSALDALAPLGLRVPIEEAGTAVRTHEIRWPGPEAGEVPGRSTGLIVSEHVLAATLLEGARGPHVTLRHARVRAIETEPVEGGERVTGVRLEPGGYVGAEVVLCAVKALLPPTCAARRAGPPDDAHTRFLAGVDADRFPDGHHYVACEEDRWSWALRHPSDTVQLTTFAAPEDAAGVAAPDDFPGASLAASLPVRDATPSLPGTGPWPAGLFAIGRALYGVSPASSLGTAQAVRAARAAVAAAHSILERSVDPGPAASWYIDAATARAARTHALTVEAFRAPHARFGSAFWAARAADAWLNGVEPAIARSAIAARRVLAATADGSITDAPLVARERLALTRALGARGARLVEQAAVRAPAGRVVTEDLWRHLAPVARALGVADPLSDGGTDTTAHWRSQPARTLRELLTSSDSSVAADAKRTRRSLGALVEAGIVELGDTDRA